MKGILTIWFVFHIPFRRFDPANGIEQDGSAFGFSRCRESSRAVKGILARTFGLHPWNSLSLSFVNASLPGLLFDLLIPFWVSLLWDPGGYPHFEIRAVSLWEAAALVSSMFPKTSKSLAGSDLAKLHQAESLRIDFSNRFLGPGLARSPSCFGGGFPY